MSIMARLFGRRDHAAPSEERSDPVGDFDPRFANFRTPSLAPNVSSDAVLGNLSVATAAIRLRSELLASVPINLFRRLPDGGREHAEDHPLAPLLQDQPNPRQTSYEARELLIRSLDLAGNAYARVDRNRAGDATAIWPWPYGLVGVERLPSGRLRYTLSEPVGGRARVLLEGTGEMLHVRAASTDGEMGRSPLHAARGTLGHAVEGAAIEQAALRNAVRASGVLIIPHTLTPDQRKQYRELMNTQAGATQRPGGVLILEGGGKWEPMGFTARDADLLASRKLSNEDVARIYGVPPAVIGLGNQTATGAAIEEVRQLVSNCLAPLAARVEAALARDLLSDADRRAGYFVRFDLEGLLRGDMKSRFEAYKIAREGGWYSINDARRQENQPPVEGGDLYYESLNFVPLGTPRTPTPPREAR